MDSTVLSSIASALAALFGVALTAYVQARNEYRRQRFQQEAELQKYERESRNRRRTEAVQRLVTTHCLLSKVAREFSITNLDILWRSGMTDIEYDRRYLTACVEMDELRALVGLHEPEIAEDVEKIHGQMNIFWGNFKNLLHQTADGKKVDHTSLSLSEAHAAATEIGRTVALVKGRLTDRLQDER